VTARADGGQVDAQRSDATPGGSAQRTAEGSLTESQRPHRTCFRWGRWAFDGMPAPHGPRASSRSLFRGREKEDR
jgi:hypothetical protein